jgi:7,8-dihydropterin-6-yl-methyl-4-(beta-D-ribofuranosyl)aminobenzene 5'-phosphate synthase
MASFIHFGVAMTLTTVFDNVPFDETLKNLWGFACVVDTPVGRILFDTGSHGPVLLRHLEAAGVAPENIDLLFCSHAHWDHMGGIDALTDRHPGIRLILPSSFSKRLIADLRTLSAGVSVIGKEGKAIGSGLYSTGVMGVDVPEQALIVDLGAECAVLTGCAHPGITAIAQRAVEVSGKPVGLLMGGFHLDGANDAEIDRIVEGLYTMGVKRVCPTHCSGERARRRFAARFGAACLQGGLGSVVTL